MFEISSNVRISPFVQNSNQIVEYDVFIVYKFLSFLNIGHIYGS